jgi:hypothetical protein
VFFGISLEENQKLSMRFGTIGTAPHRKGAFPGVSDCGQGKSTISNEESHVWFASAMSAVWF